MIFFGLLKNRLALKVLGNSVLLTHTVGVGNANSMSNTDLKLERLPKMIVMYN